MPNIFNSVKRVAIGLVLLIATAAGALFLFNTFVLEPIDISQLASQIIRITIIAGFWLTILVFINRSKPPIAKHLGEEASTIVQYFMSAIAVLVMLFAVLNVLNVPPEALITGAGFASITIGLLISTFVGGILAGALVFFTHKFRVGDAVLVNNMPGNVVEISALVTRIRTEVGLLTIPNNAISSGAAVITRLHQGQETPNVRLPYQQGDRVITTFMAAGEGTVIEVSPLRTVILTDSGKELTFLNSMVFAGSLAIAKVAQKNPSATNN